MTMLDRMRRHKNWLKWSLFIVVLAFIFLYIPEFLPDPSGAASPNAVVASVEGRQINVARFRRAYQQQMQAYQSAYGAKMDEGLLRQLGIDRRIVQQMIEEEAALAEAQKLGISASDAEVRTRITMLPAFQDNGRFSEERYRQVLSMQNPPLRESDFEEQMRRSITVEKLQGALTDWITIDDTEVDAEFKRRNEKVKLAVVSFPADKFREGVVATDEEVAKYFEDHKNEYKVPEKRKVRYALLDAQSIRQRTAVSEQDVRNSYEDNLQQYSTPEQVRASHILLKTEGKDEAAVRKQAEEILAKAKAPGADFGKLASQYTEEEAGKTKGGDLDFFGKGQMVPEFDKVAFALEPGQISDVVKTQFGFHVIKVMEKRPASTRTFEEVRPQIEDQLKWERAQAEAQRTTDEAATHIKKPEDFDTAAKTRGFVVGESGFFARNEPITGIGLAPAVSERAFELEQGTVSEPIRTPQGFVFVAVTGKQDPYVPKLEEVRARARDDLLKRKALEAARQKAAAVSAQFKSGDFNAAAKAAGLEVKTTELVARGAAVPDVGVSPAVDAAAFSLPPGGVTEPIVTDTGAVVVKVLERQDVKPDEFAKGQQGLREELLNERRNRFFSAYMMKAREKMKIEINSQVLAQIVT